MRPVFAVMVLVLASCGRSLLVPPVDGGSPGDRVGEMEAVDAGGVDAGFIDGGSADSGLVDAGEIDAGFVDAGVADSGVVDAGSLFGPGFDAGACTLERPPPMGLEASPRGDGMLELLVLHGAPWLDIVDDVTMARAVAELEALDTDGGPRGFVPTWGRGVLLSLDDAGAALLRTRSYHAWDCLNWAWRGAPQYHPWTGMYDGYVYVHIEPVVRAPDLVNDYAQLPHVVNATTNAYGVCAACGCASDLCLSLGDGGTWTWLWYVQDGTCGVEWSRALTNADGGIRVERWPGDGGVPAHWLDEAPLCWGELWATQFRPRDGGP